MSVSVEHFIDLLNASGLMTSAQTSLLRDTHVAEDGEAMASELVAQGSLTRYQADAICTGQGSHLVLGDYTILDQIGEGGMGQVFKALHTRLDRFAAIKILTRRALYDRSSIDRFYQEVRIAAQLAHPNVVNTYDASEQNGIHYLVMEYVDGHDVASVLEEHGSLSISQALDVVMQTARGLQYAHSRGIVHRDIKPSNLLLDHQGNVKILDMGLARMATHATPLDRTAAERLTSAGQVMGTLDYMPPEQAENAQQADARSDIYALGCTLFRLLAGEVPYPSESAVQSIMAHREAPIPSLRTDRPEVPEWLEDVCRKCLNKRPIDRYQSVTELIQEVDARQRKSDRFTKSAEGIRSAFSRFGSYIDSLGRGIAASASTESNTVYREAAGDETRKKEIEFDREPIDQPIVASFADRGEPSSSLAQRPLAPQSLVQRPLTPRKGHPTKPMRRHHGTRIVVLGVLGLYFSSSYLGVIIGLVAALMARRDLGKMQSEQMHAEGRNATTIGMLLGIAAVAIAGIRTAWT